MVDALMGISAVDTLMCINVVDTLMGICVVSVMMGVVGSVEVQYIELRNIVVSVVIMSSNMVMLLTVVNWDSVKYLEGSS